MSLFLVLSASGDSPRFLEAPLTKFWETVFTNLLNSIPSTRSWKSSPLYQLHSHHKPPLRT